MIYPIHIKTTTKQRYTKTVEMTRFQKDGNYCTLRRTIHDGHKFVDEWSIQLSAVSDVDEVVFHLLNGDPPATAKEFKEMLRNFKDVIGSIKIIK